MIEDEDGSTRTAFVLETLGLDSHWSNSETNIDFLIKLDELLETKKKENGYPAFQRTGLALDGYFKFVSITRGLKSAGGGCRNAARGEYEIIPRTEIARGVRVCEGFTKERL